MTDVRPPAVAGTFYPATADRLRASIESAFADSRPAPAAAPVPKALIVPHAGYRYSGAVAASAFRRLDAVRSVVARVVLLGPSHRVWFEGLAVPSVTAFESPLGTVPLDRDGCATALAQPGVVVDDRPHAAEHSLEVELPFLQTVLDDFALVPLSVGDATDEQVATVIEALWGGPETLVVVSTDLSHYHGYERAVVLDTRTAAEIVAAHAPGIGDDDACGARPLRGLLTVAARGRMAVEELDRRNSGDTAGDRERVVGYGAFAVT